MSTESSNPLARRLPAGIAVPSPSHWACLRGRLAERADQEGLLDVAYSALDSPLGTLTVAATPVGVVRLAFDNEPAEAVLADLVARVSPRVLEAPARLDTARRQLDEYFQGVRTTFELPIDLILSVGFRRQALAATIAIGYGHTATYRSVATAAGSPNAVRAAGTAVATNPVPIIIPCHRVLRSDGSIGRYRGGLARKQQLLLGEAQHRQGFVTDRNDWTHTPLSFRPPQGSHRV